MKRRASKRDLRLKKLYTVSSSWKLNKKSKSQSTTQNGTREHERERESERKKKTKKTCIFVSCVTHEQFFSQWNRTTSHTNKQTHTHARTHKSSFTQFFTPCLLLYIIYIYTYIHVWYKKDKLRLAKFICKTWHTRKERIFSYWIEIGLKGCSHRHTHARVRKNIQKENENPRI